MSTRTHPAVFCLALFALGALAACKPSAPPATDAADAETAMPDNAASQSDPSEGARSTIADAAARLNPLTSPKEAIAASTKKFMAVRSFHASMRHEGQGARTGSAGSNEIDFVAPDRYRLQMPMGTQVMIGDTMYMQADGRTMKVPLPKGTLSDMRDPAKLGMNEASMTVEAQGSDSVDGAAAQKYMVHNTQPLPSDVTMWIGDAGLPLQIQVTSMVQGKPATTTIRYSRFNDPGIQVDPPK
ncbi:MAG: hypothetical protein ABIO38_03095 [Luteimonas sp.]